MMFSFCKTSLLEITIACKSVFSSHEHFHTNRVPSTCQLLLLRLNYIFVELFVKVALEKWMTNPPISSFRSAEVGSGWWKLLNDNKVFTEFSFFYQLLKITIRSCNDTCFHWIVASPPTFSNSSSCITRKSFTWVFNDISDISSVRWNPLPPVQLAFFISYRTRKWSFNVSK